uniref:BHLH domain-containing protein n=2 Tax=Rhodosorus marinus TaxID=101924 RepID=A0A7S0G5I3_9RHOD|mmetsp:Transcript_21091/g.30670  ORF Transcript_21091/g.30670 Transcript_21091/m.30670 type:complete len:269 (+) Transcript_21091:388-1194(+)
MSEGDTVEVSRGFGRLESPARKNWHKDHSKKYRANVGEKFKQLSSILETIGGKDEASIKYKSQILENAVDLVKDLREDVSVLEVEVAMSSRKFLMDWIERSVTGADKPSNALQPLVEIVCRKCSWKYVEVWEPIESEADVLEIGLVSSFVRVKSPVARDLETFGKRSSSVLFNPGLGLVGRVWNSMRGELVSDVCEPSMFLRANLAMCKGISSSIAIPIVVLGRTSTVVIFYDTDSRFDNHSLRLAESIAVSIGTVCGAKMNREGLRK